MTASFRIAGAIVLLIAIVFSIILGSILNTGAWADQALSRARITFAMGQIAAVVERNLSLGLPLNEIKQVTDALETVVAANDDVLAAEVYGPDGVSQISTDRGAVGEPVPRSWLEATSGSRTSDSWTLNDAAGTIVGNRIQTDFGATAAHLALVLAPEDEASSTSTMETIAMLAVLCVFVAIVAATAITMLVFRTSAMVRAAAHAPSGGGRLRAALDAAAASLTVADRTTEHASHTLRALDKEI